MENIVAIYKKGSGSQHTYGAITSNSCDHGNDKVQMDSKVNLAVIENQKGEQETFVVSSNSLGGLTSWKLTEPSLTISDSKSMNVSGSYFYFVDWTQEASKMEL